MSLATTNNGQNLIPVFKSKFDDDFNDADFGSKFLPPFALNTFLSRAVTDGKAAPGHYSIGSADGVHDLGDAVDILVVAWRPKALRAIAGNSASSHDIHDPLYKEIMEQAKAGVKSHQCGREFLLYVPSVRRFAAYFMGSPTGQREAPNVLARMGKAATLKSALKKNRDGQPYHVPVTLACSTPFEIPSVEEINKEIEAFVNPPKPAPALEKVEAAPKRAR